MTKFKYKKKPSGGAVSSKSKKKKLEKSTIFKTSRKSDTRYSQTSMIKKINKLTGKRWGSAYDPTIGETKDESDAMTKKWNKTNIYLNPPFSESKRFVTKLVRDMTKYKKVKHAMIILPWYQVEDKPGRAKNVKKPQWHHDLEDDMQQLNKKEYNLGNQQFYDPHNEKHVKVRVYGIHLKK